MSPRYEGKPRLHQPSRMGAPRLARMRLATVAPTHTHAPAARLAPPPASTASGRLTRRAPSSLPTGHDGRPPRSGCASADRLRRPLSRAPCRPWSPPSVTQPTAVARDRLRRPYGPESNRNSDRSPSSNGEEALINATAVETGAPDRAIAPGGPVDVIGVDRQRVRPVGASDEPLVDARAVEVRAPDRAAVFVGPVDVPGVDRQSGRDVGAGDEALVDPRSVEIRAPDRVVVGPVHVLGADRDPVRDVGAGDEALVDARSVEVGAPDRARSVVGPVHVH